MNCLMQELQNPGLLDSLEFVKLEGTFLSKSLIFITQRRELYRKRWASE